ncbi:MAG: phosphoenolpyruvate synthase [Clostridiales bacterium GWF2_36_10]|nr:MAG: phosphoenolpyruvate synthase [Clostridiales bacterium GWF2_36_10]
MAAFERINSGISGLNNTLDNIRLGDNVVWQVTDLDDFRFFVDPFVKQAISDRRNVIYIRFAEHDPVISNTTGIKVKNLDAKLGFEAFTVALHEIITIEGKDVFYVFDSLSELQVAWSTDLMMGNFFRVTCPYLFELDTVAYFPVLRGRHSYEAIARIRETTQLLLDVYSQDGVIYLHPLKVWNRYSPDMFLPHRFERDGSFPAITNGVEVSEFYSVLHSKTVFRGEQNLDSYERFIQKAREIYNNGKLDKQSVRKIIKSMITHDKKIANLIDKYFEPADYFYIKDRMIGTGIIGGKACGMLLARKICERKLPEFLECSEPHDSFYIGTDVFYSYIVDNNYWKLRLEQKTVQGYFDVGEKLKELIMKGSFSENIREQLRRLLEYFGQSPIIVRSSSFLEDGFGNAFAGKYESIFCANASSPEERLIALEKAIKKVYASTMDRSALEYRKNRKLQNSDEQMALLVQRVSGTRFGDYFFPCAAGVGFSYSLYRWSNELSPDAGLLRLVAGMGTRAVDRTEGDYPRLVNLDKPKNTVFSDVADKHRYSQHILDVIDFSQNNLSEKRLSELIHVMPQWYKDLILEHDRDAEESIRQRGINRDVFFVSCQGIVNNSKFTGFMQGVLKTLQESYSCPVDLEYTVNFTQSGEFIINLLQCRPLTVWKNASTIILPEISEEKKLFDVKGSFMGISVKEQIDVVVLIKSDKYYQYPYKKKSSITNILDRINSYYKNSRKKVMLMTPGRIGTSSPELGVPAGFANISEFSVICEYSDSVSGFMPELSYGSHMFLDLVESNIFYVAVFDDVRKTSFNRDIFNNNKNILPTIVGDTSDFSDIINVYEMDEKKLTLYADIENQRALCGFSD